MDTHDRYFIGLPAWAFPGWKDRYFYDTPSRLSSYASVFNTVEGNTTFYRVPDADTVARWRVAVAESPFRFCFKLPRPVTHDRRPDMATLEKFVAAVETLGEHLGPLFVQFPATMSPVELPAFEPVFGLLAENHRFVVEVRHPAFFAEPELLAPTLSRYSAGRVVLDSRPLYEGDRAHPEVVNALHEKPDVPVSPRVYSDIAFVRLILHPDLEFNRAYIDQWAQWVADYLERGIETYMMIHCPNNLHCPPLAVDFHESLRRVSPAGEIPRLPPWPVPEQHSLL